MKRMMKYYFSFAVMLFSFPVIAEEKVSNLLDVGVWEVVELYPKANDLLKEDYMYIVFLPNGILVDVASSKKEPLNTTTSVSDYSFEGEFLKIKNAQNSMSEHQVKQVGGLIQITLPFGGYMVVKKAPNKGS